MLTNVSSSAGISVPTNDSLESLGLSGTSLMQLWGLGIESISELTQHTAESLRLKLKDSSDATLSSRKRNEQTLTDVLAAIKRHHHSLREVEEVSETQSGKVRTGSAEHHQSSELFDDASEHEKLDVANASAPIYHDDSLAHLYSTIKRYPVLGRSEQEKLIRQYQEEGKLSARDKLVTHNLRLVLQIARKHLWSKLEYADLVQEGTIGLMTAIEKFDPSLGNALSTYATWWIRQAISRFVQDYGSVVRVPVHMQELAYKVRRTMDDIALSKGRPPTLKELAETLAVEPKRIKQALKVMKMKISSLNEPVASGGSSRQEDGRVEQQDLLFDETSLRADHVLEARQELAAACERINQITEMVFNDWSIQDRDKEIFVRLYGLDGTLQNRTQDLTAEKYGVTRERIRQIIEQIWRKLQKAGCDSDHDDLLDELRRIAALEKLANKSVSVK